MRAEWVWLPPELQDRILWYLDERIALPYLSQDVVFKARFISKAFAAKLRHWLWLSCPVEHPGFAGHFVDGVMRLTAKAVTRWYDDDVHIISTPTYSALYSRTYVACTTKPPHNKSEGLYVMLFEKVRDLAKDGTLADMTGEKRRQFIKFFQYSFKYLDRFYVKRLSLPELKPHMEAAFRAAGV